MQSRSLAFIGSLCLVLIGLGATLSTADGIANPAPMACSDLVPTVSLNVNSPQVNQQLAIQITVSNQGDAAAGRFRTYLYVDPVEQPPTLSTVDTTSFGTFGLAVHEELVYEYDYTFLITGTHMLYVWIVRDNQVINECNEANNLISRPILIGVDPGCTLDTYENDNTCATAPRSATNGAVQRHNLCTVGDEDWVSFEGLAGIAYTIVAGNVEADADLQLDLFDQCNGASLGAQDPTLGRGARIQQTITKAGLYYVQVKHHDTIYGPQSGYDLSITASCSSDEHEPDNQCTLAHEIQPDSSVQRHSFCDAQDEDWVLLQGTAGVGYQIKTQNWEQKSQPVITLYDACGGAVIASSNTRGDLKWIASQTGPYRLRVTNADAQSAGLTTGYELVVTTLPQTDDDFEPNNQASEANLLTVDAANSRHAFAFPGDQDWLAFDALANQPYRLETLDLAPATDTYLCLYGPDGITRLACDDDSGAGLGSKLLWQAPTSGRYYVRLRHYTPEAGGANATYTLSALARTTACDADSYEPDNYYGQAHDLIPAAVDQPHTICTDTDIDWVRFWVQTPGIYELHATVQGSEADPVLTLYDTDGQTALFTNDDYTSGLSARILWPFARAGVYYARVQSFTPQVNGNGTEYRLHLSPSQEVPTPLPTTPPPPTPTFTPSPTPTATPTPTAPPEATPTPSGPIKTLLVTNQQRFDRLYGATVAQSLEHKLEALAHYTATGILIQLDHFYPINQAYDAWDQEPGNLVKANAVADAIRAVIWDFAERYPQTEYIVLVGDDRIIPHRREKNEVAQVREQTYAQQELAENTTVGQALRQEVMLTDDFYASRQWQQVQGRPLYLPDKAIGRLVETPQEIIHTIDRFLSNDKIPRSSALIIGNDIDHNRLTDAKKVCSQVQNYLEAQPICKTSADAWQATDFSQWHLLANPTVNLHLLGIHAKHWAMEMADGNLLTAETVSATPSTIAGAIVVAIGSRSGLNVPETDLHMLDWPQFYTQHNAIYIGNSSTELFLQDQALGLSRKLFSHLAQQLLQKSTVGLAMITAKRNYWQEARKPTLVDRHVLHETMLYNLPMYQLARRLSGPNEFPSVNIGRITAATAGHAVTGTLPLQLANSFASLTMSTTVDGNYYTLDGHVNWQPQVAGQPLYFLDLDTTRLGELGAARGVLWLGGVYTDVLDSNLLMPQIAVSDGATASSSQTTTAPIETTVTTPIPAQLDPTGKRLIVEWGHYDAVENHQRLYGDLALELTFSTSADTLAPTVQHSAAQVTATGITIKLEAGDASGIRRAVATYTDGAGLFQSIDLTYRPDMDKWVGAIPGVRSAAWFAQVMDGAGNVTYVLDKGKFFQATYQPDLNSSIYNLYLPTVNR